MTEMICDRKGLTCEEYAQPNCGKAVFVAVEFAIDSQRQKRGIIT